MGVVRAATATRQNRRVCFDSVAGYDSLNDRPNRSHGRAQRVFMSGLSLPVQRPTGRALLVAGAGNRARPLEILRELGFESTEVDDPYAAMTELCRRPLVYRAVILSLASLYREELAIVPAIKSRFPHVELWLAHTDGRQAALADSMRLGADGLLSDDGLHRVAGGAGNATAQTAAPTTGAVNAAVTAPVWADADPTVPLAARAETHDDPHEESGGSSPPPILTADELKALLQEQSSVPPHDD
jgi:hypothetical protein